MNCLIYKTKFMSVEFLTGHYISEHSVDGKNVFKELFIPDKNSKRCHICEIEFDNCRMKKNHMFLLHYYQVGGMRLNQLPINIIHHPPIKCFIITFEQHKYFYNFYEESIVDDFLNAVNEKFMPDNEYKISGYVEIVNSQDNGNVFIENMRTWLTNVFTGRYFNNYIKFDIKKRYP